MNLKLQLSVGVIMALGVGSSMVNVLPVNADNALGGSGVPNGIDGVPSGIDPDGVTAAKTSSSTGTSYAGVNYTTDLVSAPLSLTSVPNFDFGSNKSNIKLPNFDDRYRSTWISLNNEKKPGDRKLVVEDGNNNVNWNVSANLASPTNAPTNASNSYPNSKISLYLNPSLKDPNPGSPAAADVATYKPTLIADDSSSTSNHVLVSRSKSTDISNPITSTTYSFTFSDNSSTDKKVQSGLLYVPSSYISVNKTYLMDITWTLSTTA
ncbi:WxL domain-containing protein [Bombilactobacillus thymidiniphilus]|uniref:WxL domain-containing protein n=1 Tax=Bombilactobacillus thymidiniphilus TaxID=2923363 RepID=A0ABY4PC73_9LACO|nr:WxL domain-containing protein [Bombilactobacillus thymidiniphilus]UQS83215.1 WxL domain-containing protein [Bombilactobacillus thymidiniphilus]